MNALLSTAYWPNLLYFYYVLNSDTVLIEKHESYTKQSFRNRSTILSANGPLDLIIPVKKISNTVLISEIEISYTDNWNVKHWRAISSAYNNSPYFEYFEDELKQFYSTRYSHLLEFNIQQLKTVLKILKLTKNIHYTTYFEKEPMNLFDLRNKIHPKEGVSEKNKVYEFLHKPYYQTFESKFGFTPNLSILDLLLNKGLETKDYFPKETLTL